MAAELAAQPENARENARRTRTRETSEEPAPISEATRGAIDDLKKRLGI
jgi:hypothetical protein